MEGRRRPTSTRTGDGDGDGDSGGRKRARFDAGAPAVREFERDDSEEPAFGDDEDYSKNLRKGALRSMEDSDDDDDDSARAKKGKAGMPHDGDDDAKDKDALPKKENLRRFLPKEDRDAEEETGAEDYTEDGTRITPFNMKEEFEDGKYDEVSGTFVETRDKNKAKDKWLDGLTREEIEKARVAHEAREQKLKNDQAPLKSKVGLIKEMLQLLQPGENVFAALRRLGKSTKKTGNNKSRTKVQDEQAAADKLAIEAITEIADQLLALDYADIYELNYDQLSLESRRLEREEAAKSGGSASQRPPAPAPASAQPAPDDGVRWEYKWSHDGELFGPFDTASMKAWAQQGFFGESVLVRKLTPSGDGAGEIDIFGDAPAAEPKGDAQSSFKKGPFVNSAQVTFA